MLHLNRSLSQPKTYPSPPKPPWLLPTTSVPAALSAAPLLCYLLMLLLPSSKASPTKPCVLCVMLRTASLLLWLRSGKNNKWLGLGIAHKCFVKFRATLRTVMHQKDQEMTQDTWYEANSSLLRDSQTCESLLKTPFSAPCGCFALERML